MMNLLKTAQPPQQGQSGIKDGSTASFMADVIEGSHERPVLVDFWAPWCGPCKQMAPALEKAVAEQGGKVALVKINVDQNQQLAAKMRVQSIPAVYAFYRGQPIDGFTGAQTESELRAFVANMARLAGGDPGKADVAPMLKQAEEFIAAGKSDHAQALFSEILEVDPENAEAYGGLIASFIASGMMEEARHLYETATDAIRLSPSWAKVEAAFAMQEKVKAAGPVEELRRKVEAEPKNHQARHELALALFAAGQREEAVDALLHIVQCDRKWNDEAARKELVSLFEIMGPADPLTVSARRRLSSILFS